MNRAPTGPPLLGRKPGVGAPFMAPSEATPPLMRPVLVFFADAISSRIYACFLRVLFRIITH